jgi:hypothetical protein
MESEELEFHLQRLHGGGSDVKERDGIARDVPLVNLRATQTNMDKRDNPNI